MTKVEKAILKTLAFFDIFKRPLTLEEIWQFLYQTQASKLQVLLGLRNLKKKRIILEKNDFFCLTESESIIKNFEEKKAICQKRWQKVHWVIKFLKMAPFVKNISVINSLAFGASRENSDIDILLITRKNRLWTVRAFVILILEILSQNKNKWYQANKFCLGFAFDEEKLNLSDLRLKPPAGDIYFTYWLATLVPVFDRKLYKNFIKTNNWIFENLPNWTEKSIQTFADRKSFLEKILSGKLGDKLENFLAGLQIKRIWSDPMNKRLGGSVVAGKNMLKLHPYDKREFYKKKWQVRIKVRIKDLTKSGILR